MNLLADLMTTLTTLGVIGFASWKSYRRYKTNVALLEVLRIADANHKREAKDYQRPPENPASAIAADQGLVRITYDDINAANPPDLSHYDTTNRMWASLTYKGKVRKDQLEKHMKLNIFERLLHLCMKQDDE